RRLLAVAVDQEVDAQRAADDLVVGESAAGDLAGGGQRRRVAGGAVDQDAAGVVLVDPGVVDPQVARRAGQRARVLLEVQDRLGRRRRADHRGDPDAVAGALELAGPGRVERALGRHDVGDAGVADRARRVAIEDAGLGVDAVAVDGDAR